MTLIIFKMKRYAMVFLGVVRFLMEATLRALLGAALFFICDYLFLSVINLFR